MRIITIGMIAGLLIISGCTTNQKIHRFHYDELIEYPFLTICNDYWILTENEQLMPLAKKQLNQALVEKGLSEQELSAVELKNKLYDFTQCGYFMMYGNSKGNRLWKSKANLLGTSETKKIIPTKPSQSSKSAVKDDSSRKIIWMEKGKEAVRAKLKDSSSAKFRGVYFNRSRAGIPVSCGSVNAKNSFGGFIGYQQFFSGGSASTTFLENQVEDWQVVWNEMCT